MNSLYNRGEDVAITRVPGDALLVIDSADRSSSTSSTGEALSIPSTQPYNNFRLQKPQNLVQGGFTRLQLTEINFPYAIPNVTANTNSFWVQIVNPALPPALITQKITILNAGFSYDGRTLALVIKDVMNLTPAISTDIGATWNCQYLPNSETYGSQNGGFNISAIFPGPPPVGLPFKLYPSDPSTIGTVPIPPKSLLNIMGFNPLTNWTYLTSFASSKTSLYAPLSYTSYIDIVSSKLTYYQNVQDSSSKTNSRGGTICRLYIANETSDAGTVGYWYNGDPAAPFNPVQYVGTLPPGSAPFLIHRQFMSPKSFKWNKNTAIDWVDIQLYDDVGQLLPLTEEASYPDFQITFKCTED
jgi:hypothetical protein